MQFLYGLIIHVHVLPLEIQLSRGVGWDLINRFNSATHLFLFKAKTWTSNVICRGLNVFSEFS